MGGELMTMPIRQTLALTPSGKPGAPLHDDELQAYLKKHCDRDEDRKRERDHLLRDALYHDGGVKEVSALVGELFTDKDAMDRIQRRLTIARYSNATKLIVGEMSSLYSEPATRTVGEPGDESQAAKDNQAKYDALIEAMCFDEEMAHVNEMYSLHRAIIVAPRVRLTTSEMSEADGMAAVVAGGPDVVLDVHSAATARAVMSPNDNTLVVAWLTRCQSRAVRGAHDRPPSWLLTSNHEWEYLSEDFHPIPGTRKEHGLGFNPWTSITSASRATPDFWPGDDGADLVSAHVSGLIIEACLIKETNTASRVPVATGDTGAMPRNQSLDSAGAIVASEGVSITTIDVGTDVDVFLKSTDHLIQRAGNNYGLSMEVLKHEGAVSADARELQLAPVRLRRRKQLKQFHRFERELAAKLAAMLDVLAPEIAFKFENWAIDFGEPQVVLSKKERLEIFEQERRLGLDSTYEFMMRENPDLTRDAAKAAVLANITDELDRNEAMRPLEAMSGSLGAPVPGENPQKGQPQGPVAERGNGPPMMSEHDDDPFAWVEAMANAA